MKFTKGNSGNPNGRPRGTPNKATALAKAAIEQAAEILGGSERLAAWAKESADNERAFWTAIYPKLVPLDSSTRASVSLQIASRPPEALSDEELMLIASGQLD